MVNKMHSDCQSQKEVMALPELASQFRDFCMCVFVGPEESYGFAGACFSIL